MIDHLAAHARSEGDRRSREEIAAEYHHRPDKAANRLSPVDEQCIWLRALGFVEVGCFFRQFELCIFGGRRPVPGSARELAGPPPSVRVVPITEDDVRPFHAAVDSVARERRFLAGVEAFPLADTQRFVLDNIARGNPQVVAWDSNALVGWCDIVPVNPFPGFGHSGRLGMGVIASHRGRGIGRALLAAALQRAPGAGFRRVELEVYSGNEPALALYRGQGFQVEGIKREARILDGRVEDLIGMVWYPANSAS